MRVEYEGTVAAPGLEVTSAQQSNGTWTWSVANVSGERVAVDRVALRWRLRGNGRLRMLRHGWQSWSPSGGGTVGVDVDLSLAEPRSTSVRAAYHADPEVGAPGSLRSELVTALADDDDAWCVGFDGAARHDGTVRVTSDALVAEAYLGGAVLEPGERRELHSVRIGAVADPPAGLDSWARWAAERAGARADAPYRVGWCSWYQYFHRVTERLLRDNLALAAEWPIEVFQLDDGYQAAIGDWLLRADTFPSALDELAGDIAAAGFLPGIWMAPFLVAPHAVLAVEHPEWIARRPDGRAVIATVNESWGGATLVLDTSRDDVLEHLEQLARTLVAMGWCYLKLDYTYAPSFPGQWSDAGLTPAQRVRAGYDAIRRGAGDDTFVLGCGAPLGACIGVVDGMRVGPDVAPWWDPPTRYDAYVGSAPATQNAFRNTLARSFQHRRLWLNDPDCLMLRTTDTRLTRRHIETWTDVVARTGGMALLSDDLALLDASARRMLHDAIETGRAVDAQAITGAAPSCPDVVDHWLPTQLRSGGETTTYTFDA